MPKCLIRYWERLKYAVDMCYVHELHESTSHWLAQPTSVDFLKRKSTTYTGHIPQFQSYHCLGVSSRLF